MDYPIWYHMRSEVHEHLRVVLDLNPDYIEKIKTDEDLDLFRKDFEYYQLLGVGTETDKDIKKLLVELNWFIMAQV